MRSFHRSGNSIIPSDAELDDHLASNEDEDEEAEESPPPLSDLDRRIAQRRAADFDARLREAQSSQETTFQLHNQFLAAASLAAR